MGFLVKSNYYNGALYEGNAIFPPIQHWLDFLLGIPIAAVPSSPLSTIFGSFIQNLSGGMNSNPNYVAKRM